MTRTQLAVAKSFLESYSRLPKNLQKKVRELTEKIQADPSQNGLNFERLGMAKDSKVRSLRVDQAYRLIVIQPERGDVLLCVWVDHHDEAYRWVERKTFEVNPLSGVLQVFSVEEGTEAVATLEEIEPEPADVAVDLFQTLDDEELLLAGVPRALLASVRALTREKELDALAPHLPPDAADMLFLVAAGYEFMDAMEEATRPKVAAIEVDIEDFSAALELPATRSAFQVVAGEDDLEAMLYAPFDQWKVYLHPSQRKLVEWRVNGPIRVLGGAGTGKTVVLMHRAKFLAEEVYTAAEDRLLVTTFTRNLAHDLHENLKSLCPDVASRMEIKNLHAWARSFYEQQVGHRLAVLDDDHQRRELMEEAAVELGDDSFSIAFLLEEWDHVVQAQEIQTKDQYFRARRVGRGTRLSRADRATTWGALSRYRELLNGKGLHEWQDVIREARLFLEANDVQLPYRSVLADEVQDFTPSELLLIRALVPKGEDDLFLVGDAHQRIYGSMATLGKCGIEIRGRSARLKINYRTTEEIRLRAVAILEDVEVDDLDGGVDSLDGYRSLRSGPVPQVHCLDQPEAEADLIVQVLRDWLQHTEPEDICVAARTNGSLDRYMQVLANAKIPCSKVKGSQAASLAGVNVATMHRLKGLEYKRVLLCGVHAGAVPLPLPASALADQVSRADHLRQERCLFYVASTRARDELVICGFGTPSSFLA